MVSIPKPLINFWFSLYPPSVFSKRVSINYFKFLPLEITLDILTRVPADSVLNCKSVCKAWRNLIRHPLFSKLHLHHLNHPSDSAGDSGKLGFIALTDADDDEISVKGFHYFEYKESIKTPIQRILLPFSTTATHRVTRINLTPPFKYFRFVGSCNGLICLARDPCVWICNPITREYVMLPEIESDCCGWSSFGYVSSTNDYKVVRILKNDVEVHIYTLGSGRGWRNLGNFYSEFSNDDWIFTGSFANGTLYWLDDSLRKIVTFDLAEEKFGQHLSIPPLPTDGEWLNIKIGVLNGFLFFAVWLDIEEAECYEIWLLKKKNDNHGMEEQEECHSLGWSKEFRVDICELFAFTKSGGILSYDLDYLCIHDTKTSTSKRLVKFNNWLFRVSPHKNTFVSLKELGEEDTKKMEPVEIEETKRCD